MSENMPPVSGPYMTPTPPPQKSKVPIVLLVVGLFVLAVCGVCGVGGYMIETHSGVVINGKELTRSELRAGKKEITAMTATVKPGDIGSFDTSIAATSPISISFKQSIVELKDAEAKMEKDSNDFDVETATKNMLLSKAKRDEARHQFDAFDKLTLAYIDSELKSVANLSDLVHKVEPESDNAFSGVDKRLKNIRSGYEGTMKARAKLLDFLDKHPHTTTADGLAVFDTDAEVKEYGTLTDNYIKVSDDFVKASQAPAK